MNKTLKLEFDALTNYVESSDMPKDDQERTKCIINNLRSNIERQIIILEKQINEKDDIIRNSLLSDKELNMLSHVEKVKDGNISFKEEIDMSLLIKLYNNGYGAGKIAKELSSKGVYVSRQTVVNRLTRIGLWNNKETWTVGSMTEEQIEYANRHNIKL